MSFWIVIVVIVLISAVLGFLFVQGMSEVDRINNRRIADAEAARKLDLERQQLGLEEQRLRIERLKRGL